MSPTSTIKCYLSNSTDKAFVIRAAPNQHSDVWLPKSQVAMPKVPDTRTLTHVKVPHWLIERNKTKFKLAGFKIDEILWEIEDHKVASSLQRWYAGDPNEDDPYEDTVLDDDFLGEGPF